MDKAQEGGSFAITAGEPLSESHVRGKKQWR
jgi:hypothetical protein